MEFVADQSVHTSSILVPTTKRFNSTVVVQLTCNEQVAGSLQAKRPKVEREPCLKL